MRRDGCAKSRRAARARRHARPRVSPAWALVALGLACAGSAPDPVGEPAAPLAEEVEQIEDFEARVARLEQEKPDSADLATALLALGSAYASAGRLDEAGPVLERGLPMAREAFGKLNPVVGAGACALGQVYAYRGHPDARSALELCVESLGAFGGEGSELMAISLALLGEIDVAEGKLVQGGARLQRSLAIQELYGYGGEREWVRQRARLATIFAWAGQIEASLELLATTLPQLQETSLKEERAQFALQLVEIARYAREREQLGIASAYYRSAVELFESTRPVGVAEFRTTLTQYVAVLEESGRGDDADVVREHYADILAN